MRTNWKVSDEGNSKIIKVKLRTHLSMNIIKQGKKNMLERGDKNVIPGFFITIIFVILSTDLWVL